MAALAGSPGSAAGAASDSARRTSAGSAEPELPAVQLAALVGLLPRPPVLAQGHQGLDQHGVAVRVEGVQVQRAGGEVDGVVRPSGRQRGERRLVEQRLDAVLEPVPLVLQPGIEDGAVREGEPLQQLAVEGARVRRRRWPRPPAPGIAVPAGRQHQPQRVAGDRFARRGSAAARTGSSAGRRAGPRRRGTGAAAVRARPVPSGCSAR